MENPVEHALAALRREELILLIDDAAETTTASLVGPAASITEEQVCSMVNAGRGVICAALGEDRIRELQLPMMLGRVSGSAPEFTASIDARREVTTGISAADRAQTLRVLATTTDPKLDLVMPGHIFPVRANNGGALVRSGTPEAAVDLMNLAELTPVAAFCQCLDETGEFPNESQLRNLAASLGLASVAISDIIRHRMSDESFVEHLAESSIPTGRAGTFRAHVFRSLNDNAEHVALVLGDIEERDNEGEQSPVLARVQAEHRIGDLLGSGRAQSRQMIHGALKAIENEGRGVFVYVRHPRRGFLQKQVQALAANAKGNGKKVELREHGIGAQILSALGVKKINLLTNATRDVSGTKAFQLEIVGRVPFEPLERKPLESIDLAQLQEDIVR